MPGAAHERYRFLASDDIVAIDQASLDLAGWQYFTTERVDPEEQIKYAFALGLGRRAYDLKELT